MSSTQRLARDPVVLNVLPATPYHASTRHLGMTPLLTALRTSSVFTPDGYGDDRLTASFDSIPEGSEHTAAALSPTQATMEALFAQCAVGGVVSAKNFRFGSTLSTS